MPFTPSHAVVALAFVRTPLVPAAIAVGAMTPDLPLFLSGVVPSYALTHDPAWLPLTVLLALVLLLVWRCVLRPAARELAPTWLAARLPAAWDASPGDGARETVGVGGGRLVWARRGMLLLSLALGVLSHIAWDLFTHEGRGGVELVPALDEPWGPLPGYKWLQHGSSVLGLAVLSVAGVIWLTRRTPSRPRRTLPAGVRIGWWLALPALLGGAWLAGLVVLGPLDAAFTPAHLAYRVLPGACAAWGGLTLALCATVLVLRARASRPAR